MPEHELSPTDVVRGLVVALSLGAAAIHFGIVGEHWHEHIVYGLFFMVLAWFQVAWAIGIAFRPSRKLYALGIVVNALTLATYVVAHTTGLPLGPEALQREASGAVDVICGVFELGIIVLSLAPALRRDAARRSELAARRRWSPQARLAAGVSAVLMLFVAAGTSAALATTGGDTMNMGQSASGTSSGQTHAAATSSGSSQSSSASGAAMSGKDMSGMDMGNPDPSWHYTGPPLPTGEVQLINAVWKTTEQGHAMQDARCTAKPTKAQQAAANRLVKATDAAVAKYRDINVAKADGYVPVTDPGYVMVHYMKFSNMSADKVLDPNHVQALIYIRRPNGQMVLAAGMYQMPRVGQTGPMPGGCLTQWHAHTNLCLSSKGYIAGFAPCPVGMTLIPTSPMLHVWQVPVPGGSLAVDPTDLQVAEAAEMAAAGHSGTS